ncbi:flavodoxin family protein [Streptomyces sp. ICBB 8177]|uniref:flavodoxin family protein n=1 Tax=Streptomyces sp. ICBB 8177 TaxID=563922 RepID=UPI000D6822FE|nr:flavodoxin family protein [Streptomyces sp. ICBB 8177]PWI45960.1 flavodoxin [Streptomyces sp. ICBB 8177]
MKTLIVCTSVSHGNTRRIADAMGQVLDARVLDPDQVDVGGLFTYDLVGFGSGIFSMNFHPRLRQFVRSLPRGERRGAFVFSSSGLPEPGFRPYTRGLVRLLEDKGFQVADTFACRGYDTWPPFKLVGGINKTRPDADDLHAARAFAEGLLTRTRTGS